ncbi:alpha/beta fold hydrolase [Glycomyces xiaoerkulensis]|uniref:alpha/beta fold hydrolase n=1 Tax=Glycomyces xiaoerkulensis TaxID=2038139 RepID=UPI000C25813B|nr:alpha/beta hydrolase [Glycomyces xiaoerkulensis]
MKTQDGAAGRRARGSLVDSLPITERRLRLGEVSTAVWVGGEGPPIVLLHGHGEFAGVWLRVIPELAQRHRVIVPDLPGHGASDATGARLDTDTVPDWLGALIDRTCESKPVVAGHLLGGAIAARYAARHGDRLAHLVLVDTLGLGWFRPKPSFAIPMMRFVARPTPRSRDRLFDRCFHDMDRVGEGTGAQWDPLLDYALDRARDPNVQKAMRRIIPRLGMRPIPSGELARIGVPTTLIHGRHDLQVDLSTAEAAAAEYGWPLHVIEDCRDDPAAEQPRAFLDAMRTVLGTTEETETS